MKSTSNNWHDFVEALRSDIMLHAPMKQCGAEEPAESWTEFIARLRFETEHPDKELLIVLAKKETEIAGLQEQVKDLQEQIYWLEVKAAKQADDAFRNENLIYKRQMEQAQQFVNENSKTDISRLRELLRKIMPTRLYPEIEKIKEPKAIQNIQINGGENQILPNAGSAMQVFGKND